MAEEVPATPGWVEERLEAIWSANYLPATDAVASCCNAYLGCLASCTIGVNAGRCHDFCRSDLLACLRQARVSPHALAGLEADLEALEAEITERT